MEALSIWMWRHVPSRLTLAAMIAMTTLGTAGPAPTTTIIKAADLKAAFAKGTSFLETPDYRVSTARRMAPGDVEIHAIDTDIFYVVEGTATLVTGGEIVGPKTTGPNEIRGTSINGGETHTLGAGDMIIIPKTVPHWFKDVPEAPFVYIVIKSTSR